MENHGDRLSAQTNSFHDPHYGSEEFGAGRDPRQRLLSLCNQWESSRVNSLQDINVDRMLAGFAGLRLSSDSDRLRCSASDTDAGFGWSRSNLVNGRLYFPPCHAAEEILRQSNVEFHRIRSHNGDVSNTGNLGLLDYRVRFHSEGLNGLYQTSTTVQQRAINEGRFAYERRWSRRGDNINGELPVLPFSNCNGLSSDLSRHYNDAVDHSGKFSNTRWSAMNSRHPHWLQEPLSYLSVEAFQGKLVALAKDQSGCRFLQKKLEDATESEINMIFLEVIEQVRELMLDPFGNYVVQKLVEVCGEEQRTQILLMVTRRDLELARICLDMHGTRSVQKLLEHITTQEQISIVVSAVRADAFALSTDMNGHHVIQHCLKHFSAEDNKHILNEVVNNCFAIATDKSGCCVLQQCVDYSNGEVKKRLIDEILANAVHLSEDPYGNYVVQHLLELRIPQTTSNLVRELEGHYLILSCNKYGSNVVQRCLKKSGGEDSTLIINELLLSPHVSMLLIHPYGNYVIQSALLVSKDFTHSSLQSLIRKHVSMMRDNLFGKKLLAWISKRRMGRF